MVIPKNIYEENLDKIDENLEIIDQQSSSKEQKLFAKMEIRDLTLSIQGYEIKNIKKVYKRVKRDSIRKI